MSRSFKKKRVEDNSYKKAYKHRMREEDEEDFDFKFRDAEEYEDYHDSGYGEYDDEYFER